MKSTHSSVRLAVLAALLVLLCSQQLAAQGTLFVKNNKVGVGVSDPLESLHVLGIGASVLVQDDSASPSARTLYSVVNNGPVKVRYENTDSGTQWVIKLGQGGFTVSRTGSGNTEMQIQDDATVIMGKVGGVNNFVLDPSGNLTIQGSLSQGSSRAIKQDLESVDADRIVDRLSELELLEWQYITDESGARHLGPMAEDFHAAFDLGGDPAKLAPADVAGVALVTGKRLLEQMRDKDAEIARLQRENEALSERLDALEEAVSRLDGR